MQFNGDSLILMLLLQPQVQDPKLQPKPKLMKENQTE
jgi:hypothetical protein